MGELDEIRERKMKELKERYSGEAKTPAAPIKITDANFESVVRENPAVVVDLWSAHCPPCLMIAPVIEQLASDYDGKVVFGKLSVDESQSIAMRYNVSSIPTLLFFKDGKFVDRVIGAVPKEHIKWKLEKIIGGEQK